MFQNHPAEGKPVAPPPIDISHLTDEERAKIREVLERQRRMESETASIQRFEFVWLVPILCVPESSVYLKSV